MAHHNVVFPLHSQYGSSGGPAFKTQISRLEGGFDVRVGRYTRARRKYSIAINDMSYESSGEFLSFWISRQGRLHSFLFEDWNDRTTALNHISAPTAVDQVIGVNNGLTRVFQLSKTYDNQGEGDSIIRPLLCPKPGTVRVAVDGVELTAGIDFTVNTNLSGLITLDGSLAIADGEVVTAGCEFYVPVFFGEDAEEAYNPVTQEFDLVSKTLSLEEALQDGLTPTLSRYLGGSNTIELTANRSLSANDAKVQAVSADATGRSLALPSPALMPFGDTAFRIFNIGVINFNVTGSTLSSAVTIPAGSSRAFHVMFDGTANKWLASA